MQISFKTEDLFRSFCTIPRHPLLTEVLIWISHLKKMEMILTSDYRYKRIHENDPGIHGTTPLRAIDLRSWTMRNPTEIRDKINKAWLYDPDRPGKRVCVYHEVQKFDGVLSGKHFHIQVCNNTINMGG